MDNPVRYAVTIFSGFLQQLGSPGSGMVGIEHDAYQKACHRPDVRVRLFPWDTDADDVAESLWRYRPRQNGVDPKQVHVVVGYSYGGDRAIKFCNALKERGGCVVRELWLCDAVRRWDNAWGVAGLTGLGSLVVPNNVNRCTYFVQRNPRWKLGRGFSGIYQPAGHSVIAADDGATTLDGPIVKHVTHQYIDNDNEFRAGVLSAVDRLLAEAGGDECSVSTESNQ